MMQMVYIIDQHQSPHFSPGTPNLAKVSPALSHAGINMNVNGIQTTNSIPSSPNIFANQMRTLMVNNSGRPTLEQQQQIQNMMARTPQEQKQLLATLNNRNYQMQHQKMNPQQISIRPHLAARPISNVPTSVTVNTNNGDVVSSSVSAAPVRPRYDGGKVPPLFAIAPQQSTRCFFTQPLHGLIDSSTLFSNGYPNSNNPALSQKLESSSIFTSRDYDEEPITNSDSTKQKLHSLLTELDPKEVLDEETEEVLLINQCLLQIADYFIEQATHRACKIAKNSESSSLRKEDLQLELGFFD